MRLSEPAVNAHKERTLSTELQPPAPSLDEKELYSTVYIINLYAVKNSSSNVSEEMFQNEVVESLPDIIGECKSTNDIRCLSLSYLVGIFFHKFYLTFIICKLTSILQEMISKSEWSQEIS